MYATRVLFSVGIGVKMGIGTALRHSVGLVEKLQRESPAISAISIPTGSEVGHLARWEDLPQAYRIHPWLHAAVKAIAVAAADVPTIALKLPKKPRYTISEFKRLARIDRWEDVIPAYKDEEGAEEIPDYWALDVIRNPLPEANLTEFDLKQAVVSYLELAGNAYVEKLYSNQSKTKVVGLWPKIDPRYMFVVPGEERLIAGYIFRAGATTKLFSADEIIQFMYFHPENPYYGLSPVEVLKTSLGADVRAMDWNKMFFDNSAIPEGVYSTTARLSPDDIRMYRELFEEQHRGVQRSHRVGIMGQGMKYESMSPTHRQMGFLDLLKYTREQILGVYGVPPIVLGLFEGVNRASAAIMRRLFYEQTVIPRLGKIDATWTYSLVKPGENVLLVSNVGAIEALREDMALKVKIGSGLKDQGYTPNELREFHHKPRAEGDLIDSVLIPMNVQEAGKVKVSKSLKSKTKQLGEDYLPPVNLDAQIAIHEEYLPALFIAGGGVGVGALARVGVDVPITWMDDFGFADAAQKWTKERVIPLAGEIDDVTRARIGKLIENGMEEGLSTPQISRAIRSEFGDMSVSRSATISTTETHGSVGTGQHKVYKEMDIGGHEWVTVTDGREREWHGDADGQTQSINEPFIVMGERLMHPGDSSGSAANIIRCRCGEAPVTGKAYDRAAFWGAWDKDLGDVEDTIGKKYTKALAKWFKAEGERYATYFGGVT